MRVVAYTRVSTREQAEDGHGLDAQRTQIAAQAVARGWTVVEWKEDAGISGASMKNRAGLADAIALVEAGEADAIMATKIDRLSRSAADFAQLICRAKKRDWVLVVLDIGLDLTTPTGKLVAQIMCAVAEFERDMASERTRDGLAAARSKGIELGRPRDVQRDVVARIRVMRDEGETLTAIAETLTAEGVPTARGGSRWWPATVRSVLGRKEKVDA